MESDAVPSTLLRDTPSWSMGVRGTAPNRGAVSKGAQLKTAGASQRHSGAAAHCGPQVWPCPHQKGKGIAGNQTLVLQTCRRPLYSGHKSLVRYVIHKYFLPGYGLSFCLFEHVL